MFVSDPIDRLDQVLADLAAEDRSGWGEAARSQRLTEVLDRAERMRAEALRCASDWDAAKSWTHDDAPSAPTWLVDRCSMTRPAAARFVRTARHLRGYERTAKALAAGDIKVEHAEQLAEVARGRATLATRDEDALIDAATRVKPDDFVKVARRWAELADDELSKAKGKHNWERRHLHVSPTSGGGRIDGFVDPEATAIITAALDALMPPDPQDGPEAPRTLSQRRADAFVEMCQRSLGGTSPSSRAKSNVDILIDADTATGRPPGDLLHVRCDIAGGGILSRAAVERILCDSAAGYAVIRRPLAHDLARQAAEVLDMGRRTREPSAAQRRAVMLRDEHCQFPGCRAPISWCDIHHLDPWERGGRTDLWNLVALCRRHHVTVHEGGRQLIRGPDGVVMLH
ncbi:MAG: DUF222 domain-containing protein [Acidimicrobiia bacterium]